MRRELTATRLDRQSGQFAAGYVIARPQWGHWVEDIEIHLQLRGRYGRVLLPELTAGTG
jgi:hypothetical protein